MNWFKNMKTANKLILFSMVMIVVMVLIAWVGLSAASKIATAMNEMYNASLLGIFHIKEVQSNYLREQVIGRNMASDLNFRMKATSYTDQLKIYEEALKKNLTAYEETVLVEENRVMTDELKELLKEFTNHKNEVFNLLNKGDNKGAMDLLGTDGEEITRRFQMLFDKMVTFNEDKAETLNQDGKKLYQNSFNLLLLVGIVGVLFAMGLGTYLARLISHPIARAVESIKKMAKGDFTQEIEIDTKDEIGQMAVELRKMSDSLSELIANVLDTSGRVSTGSHEIAVGNQDLSQRTQEQASTLEEIASTVEEINSSIQQTAANSEQADQISQTTLGAVKEGEKAVEQTMDAMQQISVSSQQIADIIKVVNDIAFQTNLLALNAAVEAARAGEQGRGFAVVAAEVRNLAGRTAESSKEIEKLIKESVDRVENGNVLVQRAGEMLKQIVTNTKHTSDVVVEISAAVKEQAGAAGQIQSAIEQLNQVTQQNASMVEEIASSSESLNAEADGLSDMVSVFKIKGQAQGVMQRAKISRKREPKRGANLSKDKVQLAQTFKEDDFEQF